MKVIGEWIIEILFYEKNNCSYFTETLLAASWQANWGPKPKSNILMIFTFNWVITDIFCSFMYARFTRGLYLAPSSFVYKQKTSGCRCGSLSQRPSSPYCDVTFKAFMRLANRSVFSSNYTSKIAHRWWATLDCNNKYACYTLAFFICFREREFQAKWISLYIGQWLISESNFRIPKLSVSIWCCAVL